MTFFCTYFHTYDKNTSSSQNRLLQMYYFPTLDYFLYHFWSLELTYTMLMLIHYREANSCISLKEKKWHALVITITTLTFVHSPTKSFTNQWNNDRTFEDSSHLGWKIESTGISKEHSVFMHVLVDSEETLGALKLF